MLRSALSWFLLWLLSYKIMASSSCLEPERTALLAFKARLNNTQIRLASWQGLDCCTWNGVSCNNASHVIKLDLRNPYNRPLAGDVCRSKWALRGEIDSSLLALSHLKYLDLSMNAFAGIPIPEFIGSFRRLEYLNLSGADFGGLVPPHLGNLSSIRYLDLSGAFSSYGTSVDNLQWLTHLSSLKHLDLSHAYISTAADWLQAVNMLPSLSVLRLESCGLSDIPTYLPIVNFTALTTLDLKYNLFNSTLPNWLWNLTSLAYLDLSRSGFHGPISESLGTLTCLQVLALGYNNFEGPPLRSIKNLCNLNTLNLADIGLQGEFAEIVPRCMWSNLRSLDLRGTELRGNLIGWLENLTNLDFLDLSENSLAGPIPSGIGNLSSLTYLDLSYNSLILEVDRSWVPTFQLQMVGFRYCRMGPNFPEWLRSQMSIVELDLSNTSIADAVPDWFWNSSSSLSALDLSNNHITGKLPVTLESMTNLYSLELSSNQLEGLLPSLPSSLAVLGLSNNSFSGPLPPTLAASMSILDLSIPNNLINGSIPPFICELTSLTILDLSNNFLSGEIPRCWSKNSRLRILDLANNNLSGEIPSSMGSLSGLQSLHLNNNSFYGELPSSWQECNTLNFLNLAQNKFSGNLPAWIGESFQDLLVLQLRSNLFSGNIPPQLAQLGKLQILDLGHNNLSGFIPPSFGNFSAMASTLHGSAIDFIEVWSWGLEEDFYIYNETAYIISKGKELEYSKILYLVKSMDLSSNSLSGEIPEEIGNLVALQTLNLSKNHLTGKIPSRIGGLQSLESLDLSMNKLSGTIPQSISTLSFLSHLNLSYNNLSGRVPTGYQIQTLEDPSIYAGNLDLCGPPIAESCSSDETNHGNYEEYQDDDEMLWFYLSMVLGFVVGFWIVFGILLLKSTWRIAYFQMADNWFDRLYVRVALTMAGLKKKNMEGN